jgi:hypothetical protein
MMMICNRRATTPKSDGPSLSTFLGFIAAYYHERRRCEERSDKAIQGQKLQSSGVCSRIASLLSQ